MSAGSSTSTMNLLGTMFPKPLMRPAMLDWENFAEKAEPARASESSTEATVGSMACSAAVRTPWYFDYGDSFIFPSRLDEIQKHVDVRAAVIFTSTETHGALDCASWWNFPRPANFPRTVAAVYALTTGQDGVNPRASRVAHSRYRRPISGAKVTML
ncbi:hypothetical protein BD413DRAFT_286564 [Trametes elegans]|nr:hypothetical protein BD413DRAFT_286564 [Trametes elegans]